MRDDVQRIHVAATSALFAACERAGVKRVVHISAIGASRSAPTAFARSKADAEDDLSRRPTRLGDPASGAGAGADRLWRDGDAARACRAAAGDAGAGARCAVAGGERRGRGGGGVAQPDAGGEGPGQVGRRASGGADARRRWSRSIRDWLGFRRAAGVARAARARHGGGGGSPTCSAISAGAAPRARPRCGSLRRAWSARRRRGSPQAASSRKASRRSWRSSPRASPTAGSRGCFCSSRWRSAASRCSGSSPA